MEHVYENVRLSLEVVKYQFSCMTNVFIRKLPCFIESRRLTLQFHSWFELFSKQQEWDMCMKMFAYLWKLLNISLVASQCFL